MCGGETWGRRSGGRERRGRGGRRGDRYSESEGGREGEREGDRETEGRKEIGRERERVTEREQEKEGLVHKDSVCAVCSFASEEETEGRRQSTNLLDIHKCGTKRRKHSFRKRP